VVAAEGEQLLLRSVVIRHQRDRLVRDLEQRNADVRVAMQRAEQAAQSRARVLATASHDLRQPLHALSIYSAVLAAGPQPDQLREVSANIDQIVRSLGSLLHGLLDLSRLTVGHYVPEQQRVELDVVIDGVCAEYQRMAAEKGLALRTDLQPAHLTGDAVAIGRIVRNLLDNAIKYTDRGVINVTTHVDGAGESPAAIVTITDSGPGIPVDEQNRIFEEFYQTDNPTRDRSKGVGLGLAIVKRLCELIGAQILLDSAPGKGATFRVALRGLSSTSSQTSFASAAHDPACFQGRSIYIVDDEADIVRSTQTLLSSWGMRVESADSAAAAARLFADNGKPDLLVTDLRLRGAANGVDLVRNMRKQFASFPVLVITGEVSASAAAQVDELGAALLYKPITAESLRAAIGQLLAGTNVPA
jgi:two-component system, sensor histidine kinase